MYCGRKGCIFPNGQHKSRQTNILKKIKNNFKFAKHVSIDHRQLQVLHDKFEFQLKLKCELTFITLLLEG